MTSFGSQPDLDEASHGSYHPPTPTPCPHPAPHDANDDAYHDGAVIYYC